MIDGDAARQLTLDLKEIFKRLDELETNPLVLSGGAVPAAGTIYNHLEDDGAAWVSVTNLTFADDATLGLPAGGNFQFDSTPAPDQAIFNSLDLNLNGNDIYVPNNVADALTLYDDSGGVPINYLQVTSTDAQPALTLNDGGVDVDFRVEGVGAANALFVQGSDGHVGMGTNAPAAVTEINAATATDVGLIVQTTDDNPAENLTEWQGSGGSAHLFISAPGVANDYETIVSSADIGAVVFTGVGLDDVTISGFESSGGPISYVVEIDSVGAPDTYKLSIDGGGTFPITGVECSTTNHMLYGNINIDWGAAVGHTLGDKWEFTTVAHTGNHLLVEDQNGTTMFCSAGDGKVLGAEGTTLLQKNEIGNRINLSVGTDIPITLEPGTSTGIRNFLFGPVAGSSLTTGYANVLMGMNAGRLLTTGHSNFAFGVQALGSATDAFQNVMIGTSTGFELTSGSSNLAFGHGAFRGVTTGEKNISVGAGSMSSAGADADNNVCIGTDAGRQIESDSNVFIGHQAGYDMTTTGSTVLIGYRAGYENVTGNRNTYVGFQAGYGVAGNSNSGNTGFGSNVLLAITTGGDNTVIGTYAGYSVTSGNGNVIIGHDAARTQITNQSNQLHIANSDTATPLIYGEFDNQQAGVNVGTATLAAAWHVDQPNNAAAIPALLVDQGDLDQPVIQVRQDGLDQDIIITRVEVTGSPDFGWDESEDQFYLSKGLILQDGDLEISTGDGIIHADGVAAGWVLRADGTRYVPANAASTLPIAPVAVGDTLIATAGPVWNILTTPGAAGYARVSTATTEVWDQTPVWTGRHTFNAGIELPDGQSIGITGNELLTVNAAGNFTFSGVTSVVVPDGAWVGADANCSWVFDSSNSDVSTLDSVGIGTAAPSELLHLLSSTATKPNLLIENTTADAQAPGIEFYKNRAAPADNDQLGVINFFGETSTNVKERYAFIFAESLDVTNGDTGGGLQVRVVMDATEREMLTISGYNGAVNQGEVIVNNDGQDVDFLVKASGVADALEVQGSDGQITLGVLGAGVVQSTAGGVLSSGTITVSDISDLAYGTPALTFTTANAAGAANTVMRTDASLAIFDANNPVQIDAQDAASTGAAAFAARRDHAHAVNSTSDGAANHSTLLQSDATGRLTLDDLFLTDGGTFGIIGNELLTVNAAGNFTFSGVTSVVVPDGAWVGADSDCAWLFDSSNGDVTTQDNVGIGTAAPGGTLDVAGEIRLTAHDTFAANVAQLYTTAAGGLVITGQVGSANDFVLAESAGGTVMSNPAGTTDAYFSTRVLVNETTNTDMTLGVTVNQGANDDELYCGKSSDVGHLFSYAEADSFFTVAKHSATAGGALIRGFRDNADDAGWALVGQGYLNENASTDKTNAGVGIVNFGGFIRTTAGEGARENTNAGGNVFSVRTLEGGGVVTLMIIGQGADMDLPNGRIATGHGDYWDIEDYHAGAPTADGYVRVDINGTTYELLANVA